MMELLLLIYAVGVVIAAALAWIFIFKRMK